MSPSDAAVPVGDADAAAEDAGLLTPAQTSLLIDRYELSMADSYLRRGMNDPAVFELSVRRLPRGRDWLLVAGLAPALALVRERRFGRRELAFLASHGFSDALCAFLADHRFSGTVDALPEGSVAFAGEPLVRVTAPRIEAQLLETILLNQINFQTMIATKAARIALAAGGGQPPPPGRVIDFSPRRDHGVDAAMMVARAGAIAGIAETSNVAAAMRYGLSAAGTMAHSYVMSFPDEESAFRAFVADQPDRAVLLVDTYDSRAGVRHAIDAAREAGVALPGVRLDSGDIDALSRGARALLDAAGMTQTKIVASGNLDERRIARLVAAGAPVDVFGVGTELGVSADAPTLDGIYKLVADAPAGGDWRALLKRSPDKETVPGAKQVFRIVEGGQMREDLVAHVSEAQPGEPLLVRFVEEGRTVRGESLPDLAARARTQLCQLPERLRTPRTGDDDGPDDAARAPYPVSYSPLLHELAGAARAATDASARVRATL